MPLLEPAFELYDYHQNECGDPGLLERVPFFSEVLFSGNSDKSTNEKTLPLQEVLEAPRLTQSLAYDD